MNKFLAVYTNEIIKVLHKKSILILTILMIASVIATSCFMRAVETQKNNKSSNADEYKYEIDEMQLRLDSLNEEIEKCSDFKTLGVLLSNRINLEANINFCENRLKYDVSYLTSSVYYIYDMLIDISSNTIKALHAQYAKEYSLPDEIWPGYRYSEEELAEFEKYNEECFAIIEKKSFSEYVQFKSRNIDNDTELTDESKELKKRILQIRLESNLTGEFKSHQKAIENITLLEQYKKSVETGLNFVTAVNSDVTDDGKDVILPSAIAKYQDKIAVLEYKFNTSYFSIDENNANGVHFSSISFVRVLLGIGIFFIFILMLILSASSISGEVSSGAVKAMLVAPIKRWKVFTAKGVMLLTVGLIECLLLAVTSVLTTGFSIGFDKFLPYILCAGNHVVSLPLAVFALLDVLVLFVNVLFYSALAFMLSCIMKNGGLSIITSFGLYYVMDIAMTFFKDNLGSKGFYAISWLKYIPSYCVNIFETVVFPENIATISNAGLSEYWGENGAVPMVGIVFIICSVAVFTFAMIFIARDRFCRKDIK